METQDWRSVEHRHVLIRHSASAPGFSYIEQKPDANAFGLIIPKAIPATVHGVHRERHQGQGLEHQRLVLFDRSRSAEAAFRSLRFP